MSFIAISFDTTIVTSKSPRSECPLTAIVSPEPSADNDNPGPDAAWCIA